MHPTSMRRCLVWPELPNPWCAYKSREEALKRKILGRDLRVHLCNKLGVALMLLVLRPRPQQQRPSDFPPGHTCLLGFTQVPWKLASEGGLFCMLEASPSRASQQCFKEACRLPGSTGNPSTQNSGDGGPSTGPTRGPGSKERSKESFQATPQR